MGKKLIDYSAGVPGAKAIKDAGYAGVVRYISPPRHSWMLGKPMGRDEVNDLQAHGMDIAVCWQYGAGTPQDSDVMRGWAGGVADALAADAHLTSIGLEGWPVFFCADFDANEHHYKTIAEYLKGAASILGVERVGLYGHNRVIDWASRDRLIAEVAPGRFLGWQTRSWSGGFVAASTTVLYQRVHNTPGPAGVQIDINDAHHEYFGQRPPDKVSVPAPVPVPAPSKAKVVMPMKSGDYKISSRYGIRNGANHYGTDFAADLGTPIYAVADGVVIEGKDRTGVMGFGSWIWLDCQESVGRDFIYGHVTHAEIRVRKGDRVKAGDMIGVVGNEGQSTGPHLHFEVWGPPGREGGKPEDPEPWLERHVSELDLGPHPTPEPTPTPIPTPPKEEKPVAAEYQLTGTQFPCDLAIYCPNGGTRDPYGIQYAVFHTTENGDNAKATDIAKWQQNPANGSSYNLLFGVDGQTVRTNDDNRIPWAAGQPGSAKGIHASFVGQAARNREHWFRFIPQLEAGARWAADMHLRYGIPLVWLSPADVKAKKRGFASHGTVFLGDGGPAYRSDPGAGFPHDWVLNRAYEMISGPVDPNVFPLPKGWYYGPLEGPTESISGLFGTEAPRWLDGLKRWQKAVGIPESGVWDEATRRIATELQKEKGWPNNPNWADINGGFGGVYEGEWNAVIQEGWRPGPKEKPEPTPKPDPAPRDPELVTPPNEPKEPVVTAPAPKPVITKKVGKIRDISGPGITDSYGINATDLGIPVRMKNGELLFIFGDSFSGRGVGDGEWRSPVGMISKTTDLESGVKWDRAAGPDHHQARQLLPYVHNQGFSTVLPSDVICLPDGTLVMHVMVNQGLGNVLWTELQVSRDHGISWQHSGIKFGGDWNSGFRQLWTMEYNPDDGFVYAMSTGFQRNKGLILHRIHWEEILKPGTEGKWEPWGFRDGKWAWGNPATVILPGRFGEMYLRRLDTGYWTLTYFNAEHYRIDCMVFDSPIANLHIARNEQKTLLYGGAWGRESDTHVAQLYCGAPIPGSTPDRWHYVVSQWNTGDSAAGRAGWPYKSMQFVNSIPVPKGYRPPAPPSAPVINNPDRPEEPAPEAPKDETPAVLPEPVTPPSEPVKPKPNLMEVLVNAILGLFGLNK